MQSETNDEIDEIINLYLDIFNTYPELYKIAKNAKNRIKVQNEQKRKFWSYELN